MRKFLKPRGFVCAGLWVAVGLAFTALARDPFFPIGYQSTVEPVKVNTPESILVVAVSTNCATEAEWAVVAKPFQITGVMIAGTRQMVYMNNKSYPVGERITKITTTNSPGFASLITTNRFLFEVAVSEDKKPLLKRVEHVRSEPMFLTAEEARQRGLLQ